MVLFNNVLNLENIYQPYPLPKRYEWVVLGYDDIDEISKMCDVPKKHLQWVILHPQVQKTLLLGIKGTIRKVLIHFIHCVPVTLNIGGKIFTYGIFTAKL